MPTDDLLTVTEAAEKLGISRTTIAHLIERGTLNAYRLPCKDGAGANRRGFLLYIPRGEVEAIADGSWRRQKVREKPDGTETQP